MTLTFVMSTRPTAKVVHVAVRQQQSGDDRRFRCGAGSSKVREVARAEIEAGKGLLCRRCFNLPAPKLSPAEVLDEIIRKTEERLEHYKRIRDLASGAYDRL